MMTRNTSDMILIKIIYQIEVQCKKMIYACLNFCQAFHLWKPRFSPWHCIQRLVIQIYIPIKPFVWLCWIENEPIKHPRQTILGKIILKSWSKHWTSNKPLKGIDAKREFLVVVVRTNEVEVGAYCPSSAKVWSSEFKH